MEKTRLLIFYDHFYPARKAGGIVRSLQNICRSLEDEFSIFVVTSAFEFGTAEKLEVQADTWVDLSPSIRVMYLGKRPVYRTVRELVEYVRPEVVYLNGIFSWAYFQLPLLYLSRHPHTRVVIAPRGMLQAGALAIRPLKKKVFLFLLRLLPLKRFFWHATDPVEAEDIARHVCLEKSSPQVIMVPVLPHLPEWQPDPQRFSDIFREVRITTISLITEKKNIRLAIEAIKQVRVEKNIIFDIYGPIKDQAYWNRCREEMQRHKGPNRISYRGELDPEEVHGTLQQYHLFLLPSAGENFGHAIFEALASGTPVIISDKTPFKEDQSGGSVLYGNSVGEIVTQIENFCILSEDQIKLVSLEARKYADLVFRRENFREMYQKLFRGNGSNKTPLPS